MVFEQRFNERSALGQRQAFGPFEQRLCGLHHGALSFHQAPATATSGTAAAIANARPEGNAVRREASFVAARVTCGAPAI
jgi:hypothetical protein